MSAVCVIGMLGFTGTAYAFVPIIPFSPSLSTLTTSASSVSADGVSTVTFTATIKNTSGFAISGCTMVLISSRGASDTISVSSGVSNASGIVTKTVKSATPGNSTFTAYSGSSDTCSNYISITQTASVTFTGPVTAAQSTVSSSPASVAANGGTASTITVTLKDANSNPVSGKTVTLSSSRGSTDTISAASGTSSASGVVTFTVTSTTAGSSTYTAVDTTDSVTVTQTAGVTFVTGAAAKVIYNVQPSASGVARSVFAQQPVLHITDSNGSVVTSSSATVSLQVASDSACNTVLNTGSLSASSATAASGVATSSGVSFSKMGTYYLKASSAGLDSACSDSITLAAPLPIPLTSCENLIADGYTLDHASQRAANAAACNANELAFYARSQGAALPVCVLVDCGAEAKICRQIAKNARNVDYFCGYR